MLRICERGIGKTTVYENYEIKISLTLKYLQVTNRKNNKHYLTCRLIRACSIKQDSIIKVLENTVSLWGSNEKT